VNISKNLLIILVVAVFVGGTGTAYAGFVVNNIILSGNVGVTGNLVVDGPITSPTITDLQNQIPDYNLPNQATVSIQTSGVPGCDEDNTCYDQTEVRIAVGGTVTWNNNSTAAHTVTSGSVPEGPSGEFESGLFFTDESFVHVFNQSGVFRYYDQVHPWETGVVFVGVDHESLAYHPSSTKTVSIPDGSSVQGTCEAQNQCYIPFIILVNKGDTVKWTNDEDTAAHTVTSGTPSTGPSGVFDSSLVAAGNSYEYTFNESGSYPYFCMVHPWQTGAVLVN